MVAKPRAPWGRLPAERARTLVHDRSASAELLAQAALVPHRGLEAAGEALARPPRSLAWTQARPHFAHGKHAVIARSNNVSLGSRAQFRVAANSESSVWLAKC